MACSFRHHAHRSRPELVKQGLRGEALVTELNRLVACQFRFANLIEQLPDPANCIVPA